MSSKHSLIIDTLRSVIDPELNISIVDLGLIYGISLTEKEICITMTLTTMGCPLFGVIEKEIREKLSSAFPQKNIHIDLVFDPPWSMQMISKQALAELGMDS